MNAGVRIVGFWWEGSSGSLGSFGSLGRVVLDSSRLSGASGEPDESGESKFFLYSGGDKAELDLEQFVIIANNLDEKMGLVTALIPLVGV